MLQITKYLLNKIAADAVNQPTAPVTQDAASIANYQNRPKYRPRYTLGRRVKPIMYGKNVRQKSTGERRMWTWEDHHRDIEHNELTDIYNTVGKVPNAPDKAARERLQKMMADPRYQQLAILRGLHDNEEEYQAAAKQWYDENMKGVAQRSRDNVVSAVRQTQQNLKAAGLPANQVNTADGIMEQVNQPVQMKEISTVRPVPKGAKVKGTITASGPKKKAPVVPPKPVQQPVFSHEVEMSERAAIKKQQDAYDATHNKRYQQFLNNYYRDLSQYKNSPSDKFVDPAKLRTAEQAFYSQYPGGNFAVNDYYQGMTMGKAMDAYNDTAPEDASVYNQDNRAPLTSPYLENQNVKKPMDESIWDSVTGWWNKHNNTGVPGPWDAFKQGLGLK